MALTVLAVFAIILFTRGAFIWWVEIKELITEDDTRPVVKILLFFVWLALSVYCLVAIIVTLGLAAMTVHEAAKQTRNWWHKGQ